MKTCYMLLQAVLSAFLFVLILLFFLIGSADAQGCYYDDPVIRGAHDEMCGDAGRISVVCDTTVNLTAYESGWFLLEAENQERGTYTYRDVYLNAGQEVVYVLDGQWVKVWYEQSFVGIVDLGRTDCVEVVYPPDNRVNWQQGDHYAAVYYAADILTVYLLHPTYGELILYVDASTELPMCNVGVCVYEVDGAYQVNIRDAEGKEYEVRVDE